MGKETKCSHCGEWTNTNSESCDYCGKQLKPDRTEENERLHSFKSLDIPLIPIRKDDHWFVKGVKMVLRTGQMIFIFIASILVYLASGFAH